MSEPHTPKAKRDIWMPLYIGDYIKDTSRLTTEQHGAYLLLIMDYFINGPLPDDDRILCQITRLNADAWSIARGILRAFFKHKGGHFHHARIDKERAAALKRVDDAHLKAVTAANARWGINTNAPSIAPSNAPRDASGNASRNAKSQSQSQSQKTCHKKRQVGEVAGEGEGEAKDWPEHDSADVVELFAGGVS